MLYILNTISTKHNMLRLDLVFRNTSDMEEWVRRHSVGWVSYTVTVLKEVKDVG